MVKIARRDYAFLLTARKPSGRSIIAARRKEKEKKEWRKKITEIEKPKHVGHFLVQILIFARFRAKMS